jgi:hypothetical protein
MALPTRSRASWQRRNAAFNERSYRKASRSAMASLAAFDTPMAVCGSRDSVRSASWLRRLLRLAG